MVELDDHSIAIGGSDFLFVLPRWHLLATLFESASPRSYFDPASFLAFLFASHSFAASSKAWDIFMSSSSAAIFTALIRSWSMMTNTCFFPAGARARPGAASFLLLVDIGDPQFRG
jgi:hypothetical protein